MDVSHLPVLLVDLARRRFSGILELRDGRASKQFTWAEGVPVLAESSRPSERLAAYLAERGHVDAAARARLEQRHASSGRRELACALELSLLAPAQLLAAVQQHLRTCLVQVFAWPALESEVRPAEADVTRGPGVDPLVVAQEGMERHWSLERIAEALGDKTTRHASAGPGAHALLGRLGTSEDVERLLAGLDGSRTLGACLAAAPTPRAFATAWVLDAAGALVYEAGPTAEATGTDEPLIEIVVGGSPTPGEARLARADPNAEARGDRRAAELRAEVERLAASMHELSYYELLDVAPDASGEDVRRAYRSAAKRLHPDALVRLGLEDLKEKANDLFSRISRAHATLADPARRREYDASRDGNSQENADRLVRAETLYRKAQVLLRAGRFADALPLLESSVSLWPEEAVYHADLGWALFKIATPRLPEARAALERAVELDDTAALLHKRLSLVLAALGDEDRARVFRARAERLSG